MKLIKSEDFIVVYSLVVVRGYVVSGRILILLLLFLYRVIVAKEELRTFICLSLFDIRSLSENR